MGILYPSDVECPHCDAKPWVMCFTASKVVAHEYHAKRLEAYEAALSFAWADRLVAAAEAQQREE